MRASAAAGVRAGSALVSGTSELLLAWRLEPPTSWTRGARVTKTGAERHTAIQRGPWAAVMPQSSIDTFASTDCFLGKKEPPNGPTRATPAT